MSFKLERLKIVAHTVDGDYGVDIPFNKGLFILRVENSHGKSTCMNAIAYALGMEMALGLGNSKVPFPPSLTKALENNENEEINVLSSKVFLEIRNSTGDVATLERQIVGSADGNVILKYDGSISELSSLSVKRLFLHSEGDTTRELGFFNWFSNFVGWNLPSVPSYDGKEVPLYPATFFPTWFVEQKKGWSTIQATTPTYFRIRDPKKRSIEFILDLDVNEIVKKRAKIKAELDRIINDWKFSYKNAERLSARTHGYLSGLPENPDAKY